MGDALVLHRPLKGSNYVVLTAKFDESTGSKPAIQRGDAVDGSRSRRHISHARMLIGGCAMPRSKAVVRRSVAPNTIC